VGLYAGNALHVLEEDTVQVRFSLRQPRPPDDIIVVGIDERTFADLRSQWPFPRSLHGRVIDRLRRAGARTIVYDVQFTEPTTERDDLALYDAVARARNVVLATGETDEHGATNVLGGEENLAAAHARAAAANLPTVSGGIYQRFTASDGGLATIAVVAARQSGGPRLDASVFGAKGAWIDFRGPPRTIAAVSFSDVLRGRVDPARLRGKVVVVGATAPTLQDVHATPVSDDRLMSGAEIQANAIWSALHGVPLRDAPLWLDLLAIVGMAMVPAVLSVRLRTAVAGLLAVVVGGAFAVATQVAFDAGIVMAVAPALTALLLGAMAMVVASYFGEHAERQRVAYANELLERSVLERTEELRDTQLEAVARLALAAESRDEHTGAHLERMSRISQRLALAAGMHPGEADRLRHASTLHDVGKIGMPDRVLLKHDSLNGDERAVMRTHPAVGASILAGSRSPLLKMAEEVARTHHEHWDGSGYPNGLEGEQIPLVGRICAIADVFDALVSERPYKPAWSVEDALAEIQRQAGRHFDPRLVSIFVDLVRSGELDREPDSRVGVRDADRPAAGPATTPTGERPATYAPPTGASD
jgi:CHASE2 domain-containing sensor protein